jgi:hypothetical protein
VRGHARCKINMLVNVTSIGDSIIIIIVIVVVRK